MSKTLQLYWASGSPFVRRVQIFLLEKNIDFESKRIDTSKQESRTEEYLKMNPRGKVPLLVDHTHGDPIYVYESLAILNYLESRYGPISQPANDRELATTLIRTHEVDAVLHNSLLKLAAVFRPESEWNLAELKIVLEDLTKELKNWDEFVADGNFVNGTKNFTAADATFFPSLAFLERLGYDLAEHGFDNLQAYFNTVNQRQSGKDSIPPHWLNTPATNPIKTLKKKLEELKE